MVARFPPEDERVLQQSESLPCGVSASMRWVVGSTGKSEIARDLSDDRVRSPMDVVVVLDDEDWPPLGSHPGRERPRQPRSDGLS